MLKNGLLLLSFYACADTEAHVRLRNIQFEWSSETFRNGDLIPRWLRRFDQSSGHRQSVCLSPACIESAAFLLQRIDFQVDPCDNFYDFACGKFLQTHTVPDDHLSRNILQEIQDEIYIEMKGFLEGNDSLPMEGASIAQNKTKVVHDKLNDEENHDQQSDHDRKKRRVTSSLSNNAIRKARLFYRSCMNESTVNNEPAAIHVLLRLLTDEFQVRWPLLDQLVFQNDTIDDLSIDLERRMFLVFLHQIQPLLHFYVAPEELKSQSKEYALHLYSGTTVLEFGYLLNDSLANQSQSETNSSSSDHRLAYAQLQVDILHRLSEHLGQPQFNHTQALQHVSEVIDFEIDLARVC